MDSEITKLRNKKELSQIQITKIRILIKITLKLFDSVREKAEKIAQNTSSVNEGNLTFIVFG